MPCITHGVLGIVPRQTRRALGTIPATLEIALAGVPRLAGAVASGLGAIAVGRLVVLVVVVIGVVIVRACVGVGVITIGGVVGTVGAVRAIKSIPHRVLRLFPGQAGLGFRGFPAITSARFQGVVPSQRAGGSAQVVAVLVSRGIVVVLVVPVVVGAGGIFRAPIVRLSRRIHTFGDTFACRRACHGANRAADEGADWAEQRTNRRACHGAARAAQANTNGMRTGRA